MGHQFEKNHVLNIPLLFLALAMHVGITTGTRSKEKKNYFVSDSWSTQQMYSNNTITQTVSVIAQYRASVN